VAKRVAGAAMMVVRQVAKQLVVVRLVAMQRVESSLVAKMVVRVAKWVSEMVAIGALIWVAL